MGRYQQDPGDVKRTAYNKKRRAAYRYNPIERTRRLASAAATRRNILSKYAPEAVAETQLRDEIKRRGGMCPKFIDPARRGAPDRMVMLPGHPIYFVEMKREKLGRLTPWQLRYHADLRALGHKTWVLWSERDVERFFNEIDLT